MGTRWILALVGAALAGLSFPPLAAGIEFDRQWKDAKLTNPEAIDIDSEGIVYVANPGTSRIIKFHPTGEELDTYAGPGTGAGQLSLVSGLAVDRQQGLIYVTDDQSGIAAGNRVQAFRTVNGSFVRQWGSTGNLVGQFVRPRGIAVGSAGIAVADRNNNRVQLTTDIGSPIAAWGTFGYGDGPSFDAPKAIAFGPGNEIFVGDASGSIKVFNAAGQFQRRFAGMALEPGEPGKFGAGQGVTDLEVDEDGFTFALDRENHRVQVFSPDGEFVEEFGSAGEGRGNFRQLGGIGLGDEGQIYVTDFNGLSQDGRVQVLKKAGITEDPGVDSPKVKPTFRVLRRIQNVRRGTVTLVFRVSTPGTLRALGNARIRPARSLATKAGRVKILVRPKPGLARVIRRGKKVRLSVAFRFRAQGESIQRRFNVTLRRR